ncbi:MAG: ABC transporter permease [Actinobacteria bacterium]|nr:ABC transporter permease [Actinomycetota bacterium]
MSAVAESRPPGLGAAGAEDPSAARTLRERLRAAFGGPESLVFVVLLILAGALSLASSNFATEFNLQNVGRQTSALAVLCVGVLFVLLVGGIDLSIAGVIGLAAVIAARLAASMSPAEAFLIAVLAATAVGVVNGGLVAVCGLSPIVVTLAMGQALLGVALLLSPNGPIIVDNPGYGDLAASKIGPVPTLVVAALVCLVLGHLLLRRFSLGRYIYSVGGNEQAAWLAGVPTRPVKLTAYAIGGTFAGVAGILLSSRTGSGEATLGSTIMLSAYAAAFIGGVGFGTGRGTVVGVALGAVVLGVISNGIDLLGLNGDWQYIVSGGLIIFAIGFQRAAAQLGWGRG